MSLANLMSRQSSTNSGGDAPGQKTTMFFTPPMTDREFQELRRRIFDEIGIEIREHKKHLLINRLSKRLRHLGLQTFSDYLKFIEQSPQRRQEMIELVDAVTTNKTDFFREPKHFEILERQVLPDLMSDRRRSSRTLRVWSAASSSGEEPYSLAICLAEYLARQAGWKYELLASDISETILRAAVTGIYAEEKVRPVPAPLLRKYFLKGDGRFKVKPELAQTVTFKKINLKLDFQRALSGFDVIFCRNVLIYFNRESQHEIIAKHWHVLRPGGYLFLGHSETLHGCSIPFEYIAPSVYRKPVDA
ncbi:MAG: methyltransferase domain-containing protein [bacterium]|nr:methyltransferase domain-containing protein [bacterium]